MTARLLGPATVALAITIYRSLPKIREALMPVWCVYWPAGLATGIAAHGIGTARMLGLDGEAGAFAGLGMSLTGLETGFVLPLVYAAMG